MVQEVRPDPPAPMTRSAISRVVQFTPVTPRPLFPTAPIVPATCVPCPCASA